MRERGNRGQLLPWKDSLHWVPNTTIDRSKIKFKCYKKQIGTKKDILYIRHNGMYEDLGDN